MHKRDEYTEAVRLGQKILAFSFFYNLNGGEWRVWRPDRVPHHFGRYGSQDAAERSVKRINAALYGEG